MTPIDTHSSLRADGCGARLREAREAAGLTLEQVGARLRMPIRVVRSLEDEQWDRLGAAVFVRGQLRSYARLLGIDIDCLMDAACVGAVEPAQLISHIHTPPLQRMVDQVGRRLVYVVMTVVIVVPVWMMATRSPASPPSPQDTTPLDGPSADTSSASAVGAPVQRATVAASMASMGSHPASAALSIRFNGDSWIEVVGTDGTVLEKGLVTMGTRRSYAKGQVAKIVLGNGSAVEVRRAGQAVSLDPFQRANVVRFGVSSDGSLVPLAD